jgi:hypothetical protein
MPKGEGNKKRERERKIKVIQFSSAEIGLVATQREGNRGTLGDLID